jgi:nitrous oxide reductase accessory protein NosL
MKMIKLLFAAVAVALLVAGCTKSTTDNTVSVAPSASNEVVRLAWDSNVVHMIFLREGVAHMTDAGHKNEIWLYTTNRMYVIPKANNHWNDVHAFQEEAEKAGKRIPTLYLD